MTRRAASGESSIYQDDDGRWHGYVSMGKKENGRRDRRHVSAMKRADVVAKVRALEKKRDAGIVLEAGAGALTVGGWLDHWLTTIAVRRVRPSTLVGYESKVKVHIKPALGHHQLERLQPEHLEGFYAAKLRAGLAPGTVLLCHRILSRALKVAEQRGRVARNVALLVDPPQARFEEIVPLTADEARRVLQVARRHRNAARWSVALALGLRQGEALGAKWQHVDLEAGVWRVKAQIRRLPYRHGCGDTCGQDKPRNCPAKVGGVTESEPKTERGKRGIGLPPQLLADLRAHRQAQLAERLAAGSEWQDSDLVFCQPNGKPIDSKGDWSRWRRLLEEAGVRHARLHDARHTAATLLLAQGVPARVVMEILGHSTIAVTQNIYGHVMPEAVSTATAAVADVLWAEPEATTLAPRRRRDRSS
ncbi:tyrosine-type recombinase/integrase [Geodermatophilus chilensis]|uniref:tyrosine-type recombinase/integrase n=1 Tax=Geodermatophilus chilensis TaxID=2035835 RepID=UPI000C258F36|nr:site-specific integrase [Geodermatophilus chilensis]